MFRVPLFPQRMLAIASNINGRGYRFRRGGLDESLCLSPSHFPFAKIARFERRNNNSARDVSVEISFPTRILD